MTALARPLLAVLAMMLAAADARADGLPPGFGAGDAFPRGAPPMPVCNAPREGVAACLGGVSCLCRHERGGSLTGRPTGFRWDCGALRPRCGDGAPADLAPSPYAAPPVAIFPQVTVPGLEDDGAAWRGSPFPRVWR